MEVCMGILIALTVMVFLGVVAILLKPSEEKRPDYTLEKKLIEDDNKLTVLAKSEGYCSYNDLLEDILFDASTVPGICTNPDCNFITSVEPDQARGYCEHCKTNTVKSCLVLANIC